MGTQLGSSSPAMPLRAGMNSGSLSVPPPCASPLFAAGPSRIRERSASPPAQVLRSPQLGGRSVSVTRRHFRQFWVLEREEHVLVDVAATGGPSAQISA